MSKCFLLLTLTFVICSLLVVTGASEGIGREFALQLAKKGFNVLVSARNANALASLTADIGQLVIA